MGDHKVFDLVCIGSGPFQLGHCPSSPAFRPRRNISSLIPQGVGLVFFLRGRKAGDEGQCPN